MWTLQNATRFQADRGFVRDLDGAEVWVVAVKGTFRIHPDGSTSLADEQLPVDRAPRYAGDPARSSLLADGDIVLRKRATDLVLHASAHAPGGEPARSVDVAVYLADWQKRLHVTGNRYWVKSLGSFTLSSPIPFERMPITYERAYGGCDPKTGKVIEARNPAGTGAAEKKAHLENTRAPNVKVPGSIWSLGRRSALAGFGPIAPHWAARSRYAGTYDEAWQRERRPLLPRDFDTRFYQCAPEDQQFPRFLRGGEAVLLQNLTPSERFRFRLPFVSLAFTTRFQGESVQHRGQLHSVTIEPGEGRLVMVWQTSLPCHGKIERLLHTVVREKKVLRSAS